jgi:hypothetical protein
MLLQLKRDRPADVHILAGTRDVATLCHLRRSLSDAAMSSLPPLPPGGRGKSCREFLVDLVMLGGGVVTAADVDDDAVAAVNTKTNRLRWLLDCVVNAPGAFEFRRQEISLMSGQDAGSVSDDDVLQSFVSSAGDGELAWLSAYMRAACLVLVADCTIFIHGGLYSHIIGNDDTACESCIGVLPASSAAQLPPSTSVAEWAASLNDWYSQQVAAPAAAGDDADDSGDGSALLSYASHPPSCASVLTARMSCESGAPLPPPPDVARALNAAGITRIVAGGSAQGHGPSCWSTPCIEVMLSFHHCSLLPCTAAFAGTMHCLAAQALPVSVTPQSSVPGIHILPGVRLRYRRRVQICWSLRLRDGAGATAPRRGQRRQRRVRLHDWRRR